MSVIKITKKTANKTEQIGTAISILCQLENIHLSATEICVLSHFVVFGIKESTDKLLIKSNIVKDINSLRNVKTALKRLGFLKRTKELYKSYELNLDEKFENNEEISLLIKLDNK